MNWFGQRRPQQSRSPEFWTVSAIGIFGLALVAAIADFPVVFLALVAVGRLLAWVRPTASVGGSDEGLIWTVRRFLFWDVLLIVLLTRDNRITSHQISAVAIGLSAVSMVAVGAVAVEKIEQRSQTTRVVWRNIDVPGITQPRSTPPHWLLRGVMAFPITADAGIYAGSIARCMGAPAAWLAAGLILAVSLAAALVAVHVGEWMIARHRRAPVDDVLVILPETLRGMAPEVVMYLSRGGYSGADRDARLVLDWVRELDRLDTRTLVIVRNVSDLDAVAAATGQPVLAIGRARDVETLTPDTVRLGLYPWLDKRNDHLVRMPGILDVLLGPAEVEGGGPVSRLARMYDEIWVSGPALRDRYLAADAVWPDESIRVIGRPEPPDNRPPGPAGHTSFAESVRTAVGRPSPAR